MRLPVLFTLLVLLTGSLSACTPTPRSETTGGLMSSLQVTLDCRQRIALPADAVVELSVSDVTPTLVAVPPLGQRTYKLHGRQLPVTIGLRYDTSRVDPNHEYAVEAIVRSGGRALFETAEAPKVITRANPLLVDAWVVPVRAVPKMETPGRP